MNIDNDQIMERFQTLLESESIIMQSRKTGGGEEKIGKNGIIKGATYRTTKYDKVDYDMTKTWEMRCLSLLKIIFTENSHFYAEFKNTSKNFNSDLSFEAVKIAFSILRAAKDDFEQGFYLKNKEEIINNLEEKTNDLKTKCGEEAERNARLYLIGLLVFMLLLAFSLYNFGIIYATSITFGLLIISYLLSALFLKEWTLAKLHERILELEKERIYKRFGIETEK